MSRDGNCLIWGTPSKIADPNGRDGTAVDSPRAGGEYFISGTAQAMVMSWGDHEKTLLTGWLMDQRRLGVPCPEITSNTLKEVEARRPLSVHDRADNLLHYLDKTSELLGHVIKFYALDNSKVEDTAHELLTWTASRNISEVITLAEYCAEQNWIEHRKTERSGASKNTVHEIMLKPPGYTRLAELDGANTDSARCFVAMWFHDSMEDAYMDGIGPAIRDSGYESIRIDRVEHIDKIDDRVVAEIRRSRFVVADFTSEKDKPRGGVYYEAGFAQGLNVPVIWTCRKDVIDDVHFDTRQFNHIVWETPEELREKLAVRIAAVIGRGPIKTESSE